MQGKGQNGNVRPQDTTDNSLASTEWPQPSVAVTT